MKNNLSLNPFVNKYSNVILKNKIVNFCILCVSLICIYQQSTINKLIDNQMVVITPPTLKGEAKIGRFSADLEYVKSMSYYFGLLFTNVSAGNVDTQYSQILKYANPKDYGKIKSDLKERADLIKRYSSISYSTSVTADSVVKFSKDHILLRLNKKKIIGDEIKDKSSSIISIGYKINGGVFYVTSINEVNTHD
jgi:hypothetical protein